MLEYRSAVLIDVRAAERLIRFIAAPYGEQAEIREPGRSYRETIAAGAFDGSVLVPILRDHDWTRLVGVSERYDHEDQRGLIVEARIGQTPLGDESLQLASDGILGASVGMLIDASDGPIVNGRRHIRRAQLDHIALTPRPAYRGARVLAVRAS